jgi:CRP/FNR family transcriptional regulator, cyclic AMP receptor protein
METQAKAQFLNQLPLFQNLTPEDLNMVATAAELRHTSKFQFIFMPDEQSQHLFILKKGRVKTGTFSPDGKEVIKEILQPTAIFGDLALSGESHRADFAQAIYDTAECVVLKISVLNSLMQSNQRFLFNCMQHMSQRLQRVEERLASLILKDARARIIEFLLDTAGKEGRKVGYEMLVKHHLTQQDIANLTGTSRQTVTSVLNDLRKSNLIYFNRNSILIRDMERLA